MICNEWASDLHLQGQEHQLKRRNVEAVKSYIAFRSDLASTNRTSATPHVAKRPSALRKAPALPAGVEISRKPGDVRTAPIQNVFEALDVDANGLLSEHEMLAFAILISYQASTSAWSQEFKMLCEQQVCNVEVGIDITAF